MEELRIEKIIIGTHYENSENYKKFVEIVKSKNLNVLIVQKGKRINIEKDIYIDVLWPSTEKIEENILNNNALVFKIVYKNFSMLFTGDIEKVAEEKILKEINPAILKSDILKVAHHGSKTSTTQEFLDNVEPKIALIGVGKDNNFGHPSGEVIERLKNKDIKIYRTDEKGEIVLEVNKGGKITIDNK